MGCVQSLFNPSRSRSQSPERDFEPPNFETVPVTRQPKRSYNTSATGISVANDRVYSDIEYDDDSDDMSIKCNDFEKYALANEDDTHSVHYVEATALTTLAANSSSVAIIGTTAKCKSAIQRQRSSSSSSTASNLPPEPRPSLIGSVSKPEVESYCTIDPPLKKLSSQTKDTVKKSSNSGGETQVVWLSEEQWTEHLAMKSGHRAIRSLTEDTGPPPPSPSPFSKPVNQWPLQYSKQSNLDRIPFGVIEVLDCEPVDQRRPPPTKAQRRAQQISRDQNIPLPVIHAMGINKNSLNHEDMFKTMRVQPPSSDRHGFHSRTSTGSSTFDSCSRKPFVQESNEIKSRYTEDEFSAATEWMINMPVFAKCPPAKSKSLPSEKVPSNTVVEIEMADRQCGVHRGSSLPSDNVDAETSTKLIKHKDDEVKLIAPIAQECATIVPPTIGEPDALKKSNDQVENHVAAETETIDPIDKPDEVQPEPKAEKEIVNIRAVDEKNENNVEEALKNQEHEGTNTNNTSDSKRQEPESETEFRLTMIHSVREAVNRICEQAVEKTAAIVKGMHKRSSNSTLTSSFKDRDQSEITDNPTTDFSLPPPPQPQPLDSGTTGQESSWPPPPNLSEADEQTIAPGYSFDLPDPPTDMDQMDSETDKLDISDEEMKATGLPLDDTDTEDGDGGVKNDRPGNEIDGVMKSTSNGGSSDGSVEAAVIVAQDNGADDRAATTIQAVYRGFRARKYVEAVNAAAVKIQAGFRGYRVRQSLKNAAPSTATTTTDDSQCWSDDDQKSVVSVTYAPLKEYECEPRGDGDGRGDDGSEDDSDGPSSGVGITYSISGVPGDVGDRDGDHSGDRSGDYGSDKSGDLGGDSSGDRSGDLGGDSSGDRSGDLGGDSSGDRSGDLGGDSSGDRSGDLGGDSSGDRSGDRDDSGDDESGVGNIEGAHVGGVGVTGAGVYLDDDDDDDQLQTGDDEVFESDDNDNGSDGGNVGNLATNPTTTLSGPETPAEVSTLDDAAESEEMVQAAIKIQARVRGFAARKRLNEEKNEGSDKK